MAASPIKLPTKEEVMAEVQRDFKTVLEQPLVKLLISVVPETNPPETLETLLKTFFEAGYARGSMKAADTMMTTLAEAIRKDAAGE